MTAIVYCSKTGHTAQYAKLLAQRLELPAYALPTAEDAVPKGSDVVFLSWLRAGTPVGWKAAFRHFSVRTMGVVGMPTDGAAQLPEVSRRCGLSSEFPLFYLPGGYNKEQLHGLYRLMMNAMEKKMLSSLERKPCRTAAEEEVLGLWRHGGSLVDVKHLAALAAWCQQH